jgi:hypothetical protein
MDQVFANLENASLRTSRKDKEKNCKESKLNLGCFEIHVHRYIPDLPSCSEILTRSEPPTTPTVTTCTRRDRTTKSNFPTVIPSLTQIQNPFQNCNLHTCTHTYTFYQNLNLVCVCVCERERERARIQLSNEIVI